MGGKKSTVTSSHLPKYAKPYFTGMLQSASAESRRPYEEYGGQRTADLSPEEVEAQEAVRQKYRDGDIPEFAQAQGMLNRASEVSASPRMWDQDAYKQYASPYFEEVIDIEKRNAARDAARFNVQASLGHASRDNLGGYRSGILAANRADDLGQRMYDIERTGRNDAWNQAQASMRADEAARQGAAQNQIALAGDIRNTGVAREAASLERLSALENVGLGQREIQQAAMDMAFQDWIDLQNWDKQQMGFMNEILRGLPTGMNQRTTNPGPSTGQLVAGGVTSGLGALLQAGSMYQGSGSKAYRDPVPPAGQPVG